jgi:hypothetical protein
MQLGLEGKCRVQENGAPGYGWVGIRSFLVYSRSLVCMWGSQCLPYVHTWVSHMPLLVSHLGLTGTVFDGHSSICSLTPGLGWKLFRTKLSDAHPTWPG